MVIGFEAGRRGRRSRPYGGIDDNDVELPSDRIDNLVLHGEHIGDLAIKFLSPDVGTTFDVDQLGRHADTVAANSNAALEYVTSAELTADGGDVDGTAFELEGSVAREDREELELRQRRDEVFGQTIDKVVLANVT